MLCSIFAASTEAFSVLHDAGEELQGVRDSRGRGLGGASDGSEVSVKAVQLFGGRKR